MPEFDKNEHGVRPEDTVEIQMNIKVTEVVFKTGGKSILWGYDENGSYACVPLKAVKGIVGRV